MYLPSLLVALGVCACAAPLDQRLSAGNARRAAGSQQVQDPYTPHYRDPYDYKVDAQGKKLNPLPWVSEAIAVDATRKPDQPPIFYDPSSSHHNHALADGTTAKWPRR